MINNTEFRISRKFLIMGLTAIVLSGCKKEKDACYYSFPTEEESLEKIKYAPLVVTVDIKEDGSLKGKQTSWKDCPCLLYTSPSPRDATLSRMPSSA